jgi:hypothetical protein
VFRLIGTLARIVFGLALASIAAGFMTVLFVDIDALTGPLDRLPKTLAATVDLALLAATHIAIFSALFVLLVGVIGESLSIRRLSYYLLAGLIVAAFGFSAQYASEVAGQATIWNHYAMSAFLTVGATGGFVYWLAAGQFAGRRPVPPADDPDPAAPDENTPTTEATSARTPLPIVEPREAGRTPLLERLQFREREPASGDGSTSQT